ncbi:hypothetical protein MNV49_006060 [Pseudohyphozyma bogoriensis]|nr:hypothetical protein MNV49_006060 [Pseudohyphozyma bogoriensis]
MSLLDRLNAPLEPEDDKIVEDVEVDAPEGGDGEPKGGDLAGRLWSTKVVPFPGSELDEDRIAQEDEDDVVAAFNRKEAGDGKSLRLKQGEEVLRETALFMQSDEIHTLSTKDIITVLSVQLSSVRPLGIEWVNDSSICVLFRNVEQTTEAFLDLTGEPVDVEDPLKFKRLTATADEGQTGWFVRLALASDVKERGAASKSQYYRSQARSQARDSSSKPYSRPPPRSSAASSDRWERNPRSRSAKDLDDELDAYLKGKTDGGATKESLDAELDSMTSDPTRREEREEL